MAHLNWRGTSIAQKIEQLPNGRDSLLTLGLTQAQLSALGAELETTFHRQGGEIRMDLPREWIIFWKLREGESRLLVAHPQKDEWVATAALVENHGRRLVDELRRLGAGQSLRVGALDALASVSNLEIAFEVY